MNIVTPATRPQPAGRIHDPVAHDSAERHVTGQALYVDDVAEPEGLLHAWVITSDRPHARILSLDLEAVRAAPGVAAVLTAADIPGPNDAGPNLPGEPLLVEGLVDAHGVAIALVVASSLAEARAAASLARIEYEDLPARLDIESALAAEDYVVAPMIMQRGDWQAALAAAPHRVEGETRCGGQDHFYLETQIALATPCENDELHILASTQHPTEIQHIVSRLLGIPYAAITVEVRRMGGAFGGKESQASLIAGMAAVAAWNCRRPVKLRLVRDVDMVLTGKRHDMLARFTAGFDETGRILGLDMMVALRAGNVADLSGPVLTRALCHVDNAYYLPALHVVGYACRTNTVSNTAFRGFGGPQGMFAIEAVIARIATTLGLSTDEVRAANYYGGPGRDLTPYGQTVEPGTMDKVLAQITRDTRYAERRAGIDAFNAASPVIKKGLALYPVKFGISFNLPSMNQAGALVHVYTDGSVHLNHGGTEMGQGLYRKVAQVVAESFRIDLAQVRVSSTRTDKVPNTSATAASAGSDLNGMAALAACETLKTRMTEVAAEMLEGPPERVRFEDGRIYLDNRSLSFAEVAKACWSRRVSLSANGYYKTPEIHFDQASMTGHPFYYFTHGACVAEAAIDTLTGESRVLRVDILQDVGLSLNPAIDIGQIEGGFIQGMGWLTMEELWWDEAGRLKTHAPSTYKIPTARDVPPVFNIAMLADAPNPKPTIFRSKAIGEPPFMLAIGCWLAIQDAVAAASDHDAALTLTAPATPEAVLTALAGGRLG